MARDTSLNLATEGAKRRHPARPKPDPPRERPAPNEGTRASGKPDPRDAL